MTPSSPRSYALFFYSLIVGMMLLLGGCASSERAADDETDPDYSPVLGTWRYETMNMNFMGRGVIQLQLQDGRLRGELRDEYLGLVPIRAEWDDPRLRITLELSGGYRLLIQGRARDNQLSGSVEQPALDVTARQPFGGTGGRTRLGSIRAERTQQPARPADDGLPDMGCPRITPTGVVPCS